MQLCLFNVPIVKTLDGTVLFVLCLQVVAAADGRPVVVLNPRVPYMPFEMEAFETAYQLRQYNVQPAKTNPKASKVRQKAEMKVGTLDKKVGGERRGCNSLSLGQNSNA